MSDARKHDSSQRQELAWLLDEADLAVQSWWQGEAVLWPDVLTKLVSRLRLCGFDLEAEGIASDVQATPKIGRRGCRNHSDLMQLRRAVVDRVRKRIVAIRNVTEKPRKRKRQAMKASPLTAKQTEAVQVVGECKGSFAEAGRRLGVDRKTVQQHYQAAMKKLGKSAVKHATQSLPSDRRGQADLSADDDRRR